LGDEMPRIALLGGGTMNVTARSLGMTGSPAENFRAVMRAYEADSQTWREVPLLAVSDGVRIQHGFTFGLGPLVRLLERFESGKKGMLPAARLAVRSMSSAVIGGRNTRGLLGEARARVRCDGEELPYERFSAIFCNTTGTINPYVWPFVGDRSRERFHFLAYAGST